jgi:hypothetical protein
MSKSSTQYCVTHRLFTRTFHLKVLTMTTINTSVETVASSTINATKKGAAQLTTLVTEFRDDKATPSRAMSQLNSQVASLLQASTPVTEEALIAFGEQAKAAAIAAIDRQMERAVALASIARGTTGKGGIHRDDVVTELFAAQKKSQAVENNTAALKAAGLRA